MSSNNPYLVASKEGREARKADKPRKSPYEGIALLKAFHQPWLDGWDAMDALARTEDANHGRSTAKRKQRRSIPSKAGRTQE